MSESGIEQLQLENIQLKKENERYRNILKSIFRDLNPFVSEWIEQHGDLKKVIDSVAEDFKCRCWVKNEKGQV